MAQGTLSFQYEAETRSGGVTSLGGLPVYLDLIKASGMAGAIGKYVRVAGDQGWLDLQMILALIFLNLAGGDGLEDLERLEADAGFAQLMKEIERVFLSRSDRRGLKARWRKPRGRVLPSPSSMADWLSRFHDPSAELDREPHRAFIPAMTDALRSLWQVNQSLLGFLQTHRRETVATLDMDATLVETHKREALFCYKGFKAYQPLNCWWAEQGVLVHSEFRDGNVPAGYQQLRVLKDCLASASAAGVAKVYLRSDSAGYQQDLLLYCGEGKDERFGVIEFAISADVTEEFRKAVLATPEVDWQPLYRTVGNESYKTDQEFAEICFVPNWAGHSKKQADYRFLAIREPLHQLDLGDAEQLPFPTEEFADKGRFKLFGVVTNRKLPGDQVIWWLRERCGKSEEVHAVMKTDLAGGRMPMGRFGANAAWWTIMILAHNLNAVMKRLVLGPSWVARRMKALRFALINLSGRIVRHGRRLIIRISAEGQTLVTLLEARQTILALAVKPDG
jgi:Transposase DDE domain group 1